MPTPRLGIPIVEIIRHPTTGSSGAKLGIPIVEIIRHPTTGSSGSKLGISAVEIFSQPPRVEKFRFGYLNFCLPIHKNDRLKVLWFFLSRKNRIPVSPFP